MEPKKQEYIKFLGVSIPKWSDCKICGKKNSCEFIPSLYYGYAPRCSKCQDKFNKEMDKKHSIFIRKYKEFTAFGYDRKTGQPFWLDKKGNRVRHDDKSVRYDLNQDPHGWRKIGKKVKEYES
jgi:hypothetical protein